MYVVHARERLNTVPVEESEILPCQLKVREPNLLPDSSAIIVSALPQWSRFPKPTKDTFNIHDGNG